MTLFTGPRLLISLPGVEVDRIDLPGSVVGPNEVLAAALSDDLRSAVQLVCAEAARRGLTIQCIARPELLTAATAKRQFRARMKGASQHLCLSDGSTVKLLAGTQTHVFFYRLSVQANFLALQRLCRRAPELMAQLRSQVNSYLVLGEGAHRVRPASLFLSRMNPLEHLRCTLLPFFFNRHSAEDTANRIEQADPIVAEGLIGFTRLQYVPMSETALSDRAFGRAVAELVLKACFDPATLLVLRLPFDPDGQDTLTRRMTILLPALRDGGVVIPRAGSRSILFATQDLEEDHPLLKRLPLHILVHDSFDFWRHSSGFYARAARITVLAGLELAAQPTFLPYDIEGIYGANATRRWTEAICV